MALCSCSNITHSSWDFTQPASENINDATIDDLSAKKVSKEYAEIIGSLPGDKERACSLHGLVKDLKKARWVKDDGDNVRRANTMLAELCKIIGTGCKCDDKTDPNNAACKDQDLIDAKDACEAKTGYYWSSSCKCKEDSKSQVAPKKDEKFGCLDPIAKNYYCKDYPGECVDNKPPANVKGIDCTYVKEYKLQNRYLFCNNPKGCYNEDDTDPAGWVTPGDNTIEYENDGSLSADHLKNVKNGVAEIIRKANITQGSFLFLENGIGFYVPEKWSDGLINDLAEAFTIVIFRTWFAGAQTFPYNTVTIWSPDSKVMGLFQITPVTGQNGEEDSISALKGEENNRVLQQRLQFRVGYKLHPQTFENNQVGEYKKILDSLQNVDYTINLDDGTIIKEGEVGLINILKEEPIGLAKVLN